MIGRAEIAELIPHGGAMSLLDAVTTWDSARITCRSATHRHAANPLARDGKLDAVCGVEYAAQAMAVHGALTGGRDVPTVAGYLASLRNVECHVDRLDQLGADLEIDAEVLLAEASHVIYRFALRCDGRVVLSGRAAVVLDRAAP